MSQPATTIRLQTCLPRIFIAVTVLCCFCGPTGAQQPPAKQHEHTNQLAQETSPYLLQHAHNPVDWHPWGQAAIDLARQQDKPIFLSIGYSSCHWCHVMEHESFEDDEIAGYMNEHFICIKVDREERPDVDAIYMLGVQLMTGRGGWPLSVFLTPDTKPFYGGTYFPARDGDRPGRPGFLTVCERIHDAWQSNSAGVKATADKLSQLISNEMNSSSTEVRLDPQITNKLLEELSETFDPTFGGFGYAADNPRVPKFPQTSTLLFLLDQAERRQQTDARRMLIKTADRMAGGGMLDHLGGGFHRYSVDRYWAIPHFEKMLYDNGQLATIYARLAKLTGNEEYRRVVDEMMAFIHRDMTGPQGEFYSAMDADSEGEEGKYFRWQKDEWTRLLGAEDASWLAQVYAPGKPNFEHKFYVPQIDATWPEVAQRLQMSSAELRTRLDPLRKKLLNARAQRVPPLTDKKVLTSWNGLMIRGMADAGRYLDRPEYTQRAAAAANFVLNNLLVDDRLQRTYTAGQAKLNAYLDDYAFLVDGLIALHQATGEDRWLQQAKQLTDQQIELFWDEVGGGFFFTSADHEQLIVRGKLFHEGARPSGSSVAAENLVYLADVLGEDAYRIRAKQTVQSAARLLSRSASGAPRTVMVHDWLSAE